MKFIAHDVGIGLGISPNASFRFGIFCRMRAQNRAERPKLDPARVQLGIDGPGHVPADIVTPVRIAYVRRRRREPRLKRERVPNGNRVTGEADLIAMVSESAPSMKE